MDHDDLTFEDPGDIQLAAALASIRDDIEIAPDGYADRLWAQLERVLWWRAPVRRLTHDRRAQVTAASVGGLMLGAAAVAILWRRSRRRAVAA